MTEEKTFKTRAELEARDIVTLGELLNSDIPEQEWLVEKLVPKRGLTILAGKYGDLKSFLAMHMSYCLITGNNFLKWKTKKCKVLYIDEENDDTELKRRFDMLTVGQNVEEIKNNLGFSIFKNIIINEPAGKKKLKELIEGFKPDIVIVDSKIRVFVGDEDKSKDMRTVWVTVKKFMKEYDTTWIILDHVRKTKGRITIEDVRGSGDICAQGSIVLILNRKDEDGDTFILSREKMRGGKKEKLGVVLTAIDKPFGNKTGIEFRYDGEVTEGLRTAELAALDIEEWIIKDKEEGAEFKSGDVYKEFKGRHGRNSLLGGLKRLEVKGVIKCLGRYHNEWRVQSFNRLTP